MSRVKIAAAIMAAIIVITPITAQAAAIPYIPPSDAYIWGYIYNALGVTALGDNVTDKAEKYWTFYASLVNGVNSALYEDMKQVFNKAKTGRKIELSPAQTSVLQSMAHEAITGGITTGTTIPNNTDYTWIYNDMAQYISPFPLTQAVFNAKITTAKNGLGTSDVSICWFKARSGSTITAQMMIYAASNTLHIKPNKTIGFVNANNQFVSAWLVQWMWRGSYWEQVTDTLWNTSTSDYYDTLVDYKNYGAQEGAKSTLTAQSQGIIDALLNGVDLILTAHSQVVDGSVDDTKPIVIDLPITLPVPAVTIADLPTVQDDLGVLPLPMTENPAATVSDIQDTQTASFGTTGDYQLDLTELFPFCIPFDIARVIGLFVAEPQTPVFHFMFPVGYEDGEFIFQTFEMDLAALDGVAVWVRRGMLAVFVVGLGMVTRQVFLRG